MIRILDGKRYNSSGGQKIARVIVPYGQETKHEYEITLRRTDRGNWFLCSRPYGLALPGVYQDLDALTPRQAQRWLEIHNRLDILEEHFDIEDA